MVKRIIYHIGDAKTGTTTLQRCLSQNRGTLKRQNILYPNLIIDGIAHELLTIATHSRIQRSMVSKVGSDYKKALKISLDAWKDLGEKVANEQPETLIISSEFFLYAPRLEVIVELTRKYLSENAQLVFLCYLRQPSDWYVSALQQQLKANWKIPPIKLTSKLKIISKFSEIGDVLVRSFSPDHLKDGDILSDFCSALMIDQSEFQLSKSRENKSLSAESTILLQAYRLKYHFDRQDVFTHDTTQFINRLIKEEERNPSRFTKLQLKPEIAQFLDQRTRETEELKRLYGVDLYCDHGVEPINESQLSCFVDAKDVIVFDQPSLDELNSLVS